MTTIPNHGQTPQGYEVRIAGHLDAYWSAWFDGLSIIQLGDGTTVLRGIRLDQAELHGLLAKIRDLGVTLISVTPASPKPCDHPRSVEPGVPIPSRNPPSGHGG